MSTRSKSSSSSRIRSRRSPSAASGGTRDSAARLRRALAAPGRARRLRISSRRDTCVYRARRFQAGRHDARAALSSRLPRGESPVLRQRRDERGRRRRLRGAGRAADRGILLRLERASGGRHPEAARAGRQGPRAHQSVSSPEHLRLNFSDPWREVDGERSSAKSSHPLLSASDGARGPRSPRRPRGDPGADLRARRPGHGELPQYTSALQVRAYLLGSTAPIAPTRRSRRRGGSGAPTASARARASGSSSCSRRRSMPRAPEDAGHRQAGRRARGRRDGSEIGDRLRLLLPPTPPILTPVCTSSLICRCTRSSWAVRTLSASWNSSRPQIAQKDNKWALGNNTRWKSDEYDRLEAAEREMDAVKRAALFIRMNDMVVREGVVIPIVWRNEATAVTHRLRGVEITPWGSDLESRLRAPAGVR